MDLDLTKTLITRLQITFLLCFCVACQEGNSDNEITGMMCPYMRLCNKEPLLIDHGEDKTPCCLPCSCDSDCIHLHNCCPDYDRPPGNPPAPTRSCRSTGYNGAKSEFYYYTRDSCPADFNDTDVATKCLGDDVESWKDIVMVWSQSRKEVYLNIHCAQCHGVTDASFWQVRHTDCSILSTADTVPLPQELPSSCKISFEPPNPRDPNVLAKTCFPDSRIVSNCRAQGFISFEWLERCENSHENYYYLDEFPIGTVVYKNVFCYLCNNLHSALTDEICSKDWVPDPEKIGARLNMVPFTMLLNIAIISEEAKQECQSNEVYDELKMGCRKLHCPFYEIPLDGKCVERNPRSVGLPIRILLNVTSSEPFPSPSLTNSFLKTVNDKLPLFRPNLCGVCTAKAFLDAPDIPDFVEHFVLSVTLHTTPDCQAHAAVELVQSMFDHLNVSINGKELNFRMQIVLKKQDVDLYTPARMASAKLTDKCDRFVAVTVDEFTSACPYILLSDRDLGSAISNNRVAPDDVLYSKSANVTERIAVCWSTFLDGFKRHKASIKNTTLTTGVVSVVFASMSLVCILVVLVAFGVMKQLTTLPVVMLILLSANLFLAQIFFIFGTVQTDNTWLCFFFGIVIHYFWLAVVLSMNAYMFLVNRAVNSTEARTSSGGQLEKRTLLTSILFIYSCPCIFVGINIGVSRLLYDSKSLGYGGDICFIESTLMRISVFAVPVGIVVLANCFLYCLTVRQVRNVGRAVATQSVNHDQYMTVYLRLSVLTGVSWLFGFIFEFTRDPFTEYCFIILTTGQGIFIMLCFICRPVVLRKALRFSERQGRSHSS